MIPACRLWEKVSAKGNRYLIGRLGGVRVMVLQNTRPEAGDTSTHTLMFDAAPAYNGTQGQAAPAAEPSEQPSPATRQRKQHGEDKRPIDDDPVPF